MTLLGRRSVAGTYVAERNTPSSYTLVCTSESTKARRWSITGDGFGGSGRRGSSGMPGRPRRGSIGRHGDVRCMLLSDLGHVLAEEKQDKADELDGDMETTEKNVDGHYPTVSSSSTRVSSMDSAATPRGHSDSEFRDFLTTRCGWIQESRGLPQDHCCKRKWHILLLSRTFKEKSHQRVVDTLVEVLHLSAEEANSKASDASAGHRRMTAIHTCVQRDDAFSKMQALRSKGLLVQIASDSGLPGARVPSERSKSPRKASYGEVFDKATEMQLTGTVGQIRRSSLPAVVLPTAEASSRRPAVSARRKSGPLSGGSESLEVQVEDLEAMPASSAEARSAEEQSMQVDAGKSMQWMQASHERDGKWMQAQPAPATHTSTPRGTTDSCCEGLPTVKLPKTSGSEGKRMQELVSKHMNIGRRESTGSRMWGSVLDSLKQQAESKKDFESKREACKMLRCFVFGSVGNEDAKTVHERDVVFKESMGTMEQVRALHQLWRQLDEDNSGRVDIMEFRACAERRMRHGVQVGPAKKSRGVPPAEDHSQFAAGLCEKVERYLLGKKSSFIIDDMMKLLWLGATPCDIKTMKSWCAEFVGEASRARVLTPPPLELEEYEDLCSVFRHFDDESCGEIKFSKLMDRGIIYEDQLEQCQRDWDSDGNGGLDMQEFCEMLCPVGFRACEESKVGTQKDGKRVIYDGNIDGWRLEVMSPPRRQRKPIVEVSPRRELSLRN